MRKNIITTIKISEYTLEGKKRYLCEMEGKNTNISFNDTTLKKVVKQIPNNLRSIW